MFLLLNVILIHGEPEMTNINYARFLKISIVGDTLLTFQIEQFGQNLLLRQSDQYSAHGLPHTMSEENEHYFFCR